MSAMCASADAAVVDLSGAAAPLGSAHQHMPDQPSIFDAEFDMLLDEHAMSGLADGDMLGPMDSTLVASQSTCHTSQHEQPTSTPALPALLAALALQLPDSSLPTHCIPPAPPANIPTSLPTLAPTGNTTRTPSPPHCKAVTGSKRRAPSTISRHKSLENCCDPEGHRPCLVYTKDYEDRKAKKKTGKTVYGPYKHHAQCPARKRKSPEAYRQNPRTPK